MKKEKLAAILSEHKAWLDGKPKGIQADLSGANLRWANLSGGWITWIAFIAKQRRCACLSLNQAL